MFNKQEAVLKRRQLTVPADIIAGTTWAALPAGGWETGCAIGACMPFLSVAAVLGTE